VSERDGRLTVDGDRAVLNFERRLPFPIEVVWSAITDPDEREQWFGVTTIEPRQGGMIDMVATGPPLPPERKRMTGRILVWDPPNVLEHEWKQPIVEDGVVRYELSRPISPATSCLTGRPVAMKSPVHRLTETDMSHNGSHIAAPSLAIAYHSGFGHTAMLADAVAAGAREAGADVSVIAVDRMTDGDWDLLDGADGIVFGSATYMGNVSAGFQAFAEQTGRRCLNGSWRDKVAAGFTNSGAKSGDKVQTLVSLAVFAAQHHMHWVSLGLGAGWNSSTGSENDLNRLGFWLGAGAQTDVDADPDQVHPSDVQTCHHLVQRVALVTRQLNVGRAATPAASSPGASSAPAR
jgi:NAD(P)H dehydrogenase (quinone)